MTGPHWIIVPIVLPLLVGALAIVLERRARAALWPLSLLTVLALAAVNLGLLERASGGTIEAYLLGNWRAPFGIALALDRLAALMLSLTTLVALASLLYARGKEEFEGPFFHPLFMFQLMGLNGAFLTADLFNLFVFFEVLLIASYGLVLHGAARARLNASIHYVVFNLTASTLFLFALALIYATTGTLNMADLAVRAATISAADAPLLHAAALMLLVVFCVKAALLPLYFWLPETYAAACASAAALFAIMTKVGVYSIARTYTLAFGVSATSFGPVATPWLPTLALGTLALAAIGVLAARRLRTLAAYWVVGSAGTLLFTLGMGSEAALGAGLFYLVPSTLTAAALFLVIDRIARARGAGGDTIDGRAWHGTSRWGLALAFLFCALSAAGLPPLGGFLAKIQVLVAALESGFAALAWPLVLLAGLAYVVAFARVGSELFWKAPAGLARAESITLDASRTTQYAAIMLLGASLAAVAILAAPLARYASATASQLLARTPYIDAVLGQPAVTPAWNPRAGMIKEGAAGSTGSSALDPGQGAPGQTLPGTPL